MSLIAILASLLTGAAAQEPPPPPPAQLRSYAVPGQPDLARYFTAADYPAAALAAGQSGLVVIQLDIGADGRVNNCAVVNSSGSASIDAATCRILRARARYRPARDSDGRAVPDRHFERLRWILPVGRPGTARATPAMVVSVPIPLLVAPPPPPAPLPPPRLSSGPGATPPRRATSSLGAYFSADDYPAAALRANERGTVFFRLTVAPNGRVEECVVTRSSGSAILDAATCRIIRSRARYEPARDADGRFTYGTDTGRIIWSLPQEGPALAPPDVAIVPDLPRRGRPPIAVEPIADLFASIDYPEEAALPGGAAPPPTSVNVLIGADGGVSQCRVVAASGLADLDDMACRVLTARARFTPAQDRRGRPVAIRARIRLRWGEPEL